MIWLVSFIAFIVYWRKKVNAKKSAGENYLDDENYKNVSKMKRIIGAVCIASFVIASVIPASNDNPGTVQNDLKKNIQSDGKSFGVTPEEFAKNFNEQIENYQKHSTKNLNHLKIVRVNKATDSENFFFFVQNNNSNARFDGITNGKNLVSITYSISNVSNADIMLISDASVKSVKENNNFAKKISNFFSDKKKFNDKLNSGKSAFEVFKDNDLEVNINVDGTSHHYFGIYTEEHIKHIRSK